LILLDVWAPPGDPTCAHFASSGAPSARQPVYNAMREVNKIT
jgi:hypothetical protein